MCIPPFSRHRGSVSAEHRIQIVLSCFRVIYLVSLQFLSVETCGRGAYLPFQGIVVGLDDWLSGFCHGYTEQSGFFGADLCGSSLFLSAIRVDGLQKLSSLKSNRSLENDSKNISMTDLIS